MILPFPSFEPRRARDLLHELERQAALLLPDWEPAPGEEDAGRALLRIIARLETEVARRLDRLPERSFGAFLDYLGIPQEPARSAKTPLVFVPTAEAVEPFLARAGAKVSSSGEPPLVFETTADLSLQPARPILLAAVDGPQDKIFLPPPGFLKPEPPGPPAPLYRAVVQANKDDARLQLDPIAGLAPGDILWIGGREHRITLIERNVVSLEPALEEAVTREETIRKVTTFDAFGGRNRQEHFIYLGHADVLEIQGEATIALTGITDLMKNQAWEIWGKEDSASEPAWLECKRLDEQPGVNLTVQLASVEPREIEGRQSRWLRCRPPEMASVPQGIGLRVSQDHEHPTERLTRIGAADVSRTRARLEFLHNTTPLATDQPFYPFGIEPRLFDAFYLAAPDVFIKPDASVRIEIETANATLTSLVAAQGTNGFRLVGIDSNGGLQSLQLQSPLAVDWQTIEAPTGKDVPGSESEATPLQLRAVTVAGDRLVATDGQWVFARAVKPEDLNGWSFLGAPEATKGSIFDLVLLRDAQDALNVYLLVDGELHGRPLTGGTWNTVNIGGGHDPLAAAMAVQPPSAETATDSTDGLVLIDENGQVLWWRRNQDPVRGGSALRLRPSMPAVAWREKVTDQFIRVAGVAAEPAPSLHAASLGVTNGTTHSVPLSGLSVDGSAFARRRLDDSTSEVILLVRDEQGVRLASLLVADEGITLIDRAYPPAPSARGFRSGPCFARFPGGTGGLVLLVPGANRDVLFRTVATLATVTLPGEELRAGLLIAPAPSIGLIERMADPAPHRLHAIEKSITVTGLSYHRPATGLSPLPDAGDLVRRFKIVGTTLLLGRWSKAQKLLRLAKGDSAVVGDLLAVIRLDGSNLLFEVADVKQPGQASGRIKVELQPQPTFATGELSYRHVELVDQVVVHSVRPSLPWPAALGAPEEDRHLAILGAHPAEQWVLGGDATEALAVLAEPLEEIPLAQPLRIVPLEQQAGDWGVRSLQRVADPELSWEYFDGRGWWRIATLNDGTDALSGNGSITFEVPADLRPTEVAGRERPWIRARIVGGGYQRDTYRLITTKVDRRTTKQEVTRVHEGAPPPRVLSLKLGYNMTQPVPPQQLLAQNNLAMVDLTGVNALAGAELELFQTAQRLLEPPSTETARALLLGFDRPLQGGPIGLLPVVARELSTRGRLAVDARLEEGWRPVAAVDDRSHGLAKSGLVTFYLPQSPVRCSLLGREAHWLRLSTPSSVWSPVLDGLHINATPAEAGEAQAAEVLGSSIGAPDQHFQLTRSPMLWGSLELRVREPLGDDEVAELRLAQGERAVVTSQDLGGSWVLWQPVLGEADGGPEARRFGIDPGIGLIIFGDGRSARIPPIGRDNIRAFAYRVTSGASGNIAPFAELAASTPLPGLERVLNPLAAAGGADPAPPERTHVLAPARLGGRDRVRSLRDLERLARAFGPEIAQAHARQIGRRMRLVVVRAGARLQPSRAELDALRRFILDRAAPALAAEGALEVTAPKLRLMRLQVPLEITDVGITGAVAEALQEVLLGLLDPLTGAVDGQGWPLGRRLDRIEVSAALDGIEGIVSIGDIVVTDCEPGPWRPDELARLEPGAIEPAITVHRTRR